MKKKKKNKKQQKFYVGVFRVTTGANLYRFGSAGSVHELERLAQKEGCQLVNAIQTDDPSWGMEQLRNKFEHRRVELEHS